MKGIEVRGVTKQYGKVTALGGVDVSFGENKIYGLLGRNGAGKTSLLNIITARIFASSGEVLVDGEPSLENRAALGKIYMTSEQTLLPEGMKVRDVFRWTRRFYPTFDTDYASEISAKFGLDERKAVKQLSTGYVSILKLVLALSANTPYLILDEPILGLDPNNRDLFYRLLLQKYSDNPFTVILSTHLIEEISPILEEVVIIKDGGIIRHESRDQLLQKGFAVSGPEAKVDAFIAGRAVLGVETLGGYKMAYLYSEDGERPEAGDDLVISKIDLQKLFIHLTNS